MKIRNILENISSQQRGVGQLPANFQPAQTSPQLNGPYPGRNATRGYLVGEDQDMAEGHADQQRKIFKKNGQPVGEVGIDRESSPGVGQYYMKHYASSTDNSGYDSFEDALAELRHVMKQSIYGELREQGVAEGKDISDMEMHKLNVKRFRKDLGLPDRDQPKRDRETDMDIHRYNAERFRRDLGLDKKPGVAEGTDFFDKFGLPIMPDDDGKFRNMMRGIKRGTKKQARADRRERDAASRERAQAAFGPSPADKLSIRRDQGVSEGSTRSAKFNPKTGMSVKQQISEFGGDSTQFSTPTQSIPTTDQSPRRGFSILLTGRPGKDWQAKYAWEALEKVFPKEYPPPNNEYVGGPAVDKVRELLQRPSAVIKTGIASRDIAETLVAKLTANRVPAQWWQIASQDLDEGVRESGYNPLADERREQSQMDAERLQFKRRELAAELGGEEQRAQQIMRGTWYIVIDGQVWKRQGQPVTFAGRDAARRAGQTIKNRTPERTVTITTRIPAAESHLAEAPLDIDLIKRAQGGMAGTNQDSDSERFRDQPYGYRDRAKNTFDPMARLDKGAVNSIERALGIKWPKHRAWQGTVKVDESRDQHYLQMFREAVASGMTSEDVLTTMKRRLGDYIQDVATAIKKDPDLVSKIPKAGDQIGPAVRTIKTDDGHEIRIHGNEDDGFRISIRNRTIPSRFTSLDEAEIATEMYCARRRQATQLRDDYVDEA